MPPNPLPEIRLHGLKQLREPAARTPPTRALLVTPQSVFASAAVPSAFVPIRLPATSVTPITPSKELPLTTLSSTLPVGPLYAPCTPNPFGIAAVPAAFVPIRSWE